MLPQHWLLFALIQIVFFIIAWQLSAIVTMRACGKMWRGYRDEVQALSKKMLETIEELSRRDP
jgi:hypothetical protein